MRIYFNFFFIDITEDITDAPDDEIARKRYDIFRRDDIPEHELANEIIKRHARYNVDYDEAEVGEEENEIAQQSLLPTINDPKIWRVYCKKGHEKKVVGALLVKYLSLQYIQPLQIYSVIALDQAYGAVYIEADSEYAITEALKNIGGVLKREPTLVPISEMPELFKTTTVAPTNLKRGDWVRVTRGLYENDLGRVYYYKPNSDEATIQLVPRIDIKAWARKNLDLFEEKEEESEEEEDTNKKKRKRTKTKQKKKRPPPKLFNPEDVRLLPGGENVIHEDRMSASGETYYIFERNKFKDGFVYKQISLKNLQTTNVHPTFDELEIFSGALKSKGGDSTESDMPPPKLSSIPDKEKLKKLIFNKGDEIEVIKGELVSVVGIVISTENNKVVFKPKNEKLYGKNLLTLPIDQVRKHFKSGDHVIVLKGSKHEGETGFVTSISDDVAVIYSDSGDKTFKVFTSDLQLSSEISPKVLQPNTTKPMGGGRGNDIKPQSSNTMNRGKFRDNKRLLNKSVIITRGQWKGHIGKVTNVINNSVKVVLSSQTKTVTVDQDMVREQDMVDTHRQESSYISAPATPRRTATPRRPSTPSHNTPWNPITAPPTPGYDESWNKDEDTTSLFSSKYSGDGWGSSSFDVQTPMNPHTPHTPNIPHTPHTPYIPTTPHTPNPQTPHTPNPQTPRTPSTPLMPYTPHPMTPMTPGGVSQSLSSSGNFDTNDFNTESMNTEKEAEKLNEWHMPLIEITITSGPHKDKNGIITTVNDDACEVKLLENDEVVTVQKSALSLVVPEKKDKVIIVVGELRGETGVILGLDSNASDSEATYGIVKLSNLDIKVLDMSYVAKYHGED